MEQDKAKKVAGYRAADLIEQNMIIGLGTGSTVRYFIDKLSERVRDGLRIQAVSSSLRSLEQASKGGIPLVDINQLSYIDTTVDGADEIDSQKRMIKGGGGALLREKIIASMSREMIVIVDETKVCDQLGRCKLPVEITPFAYGVTIKKIAQLGYESRIRYSSDHTIYVTDNGNYIVDITFHQFIEEPLILDHQLKSIPGVIETGFFFNLAGRVIIGYSDGKIVIKP